MRKAKRAHYLQESQIVRPDGRQIQKMQVHVVLHFRLMAITVRACKSFKLRQQNNIPGGGKSIIVRMRIQTIFTI